MRRFVFLMVLVVGSLFGLSNYSNSFNIDMVCQLTAEDSRLIAIEDDIAYYAKGRRLVARDISTMESNVELGGLTVPKPSYSNFDSLRMLLQSDIRIGSDVLDFTDMDVRDGLVFICDWSSAYIIDFSTPSEPELIWQFNSSIEIDYISGIGYFLTEPSPNLQIFLKDDYLFLANRGATHVYELTDMETPLLSYSKRTIAQMDELMILTSGDSIFIGELSDPYSPEFIALDDGLAGILSGADVVNAGRIAYIYADTVVHIVDFTSPESPVAEGTIAVEDNSALFVQGSNLFVSSASVTERYDISVPLSPVLTDTYTDFAGFDYANDDYLVDVRQDSHIFWSPAETTVDTLSNYRFFSSWDYDGDYLYTLGNDLLVWDISDPYSMHIVSTVEGLSGNYHHLYQYKMVHIEQYIWAVTVEGEIVLVDVSDPYSPSIIDTMDISDAQMLASDGENLFLWTNETLSIYDVSTPLSPSLLSSIDRTGDMSPLIENDMLYVCSDGVLSLYNISDPHKLELVRAYDTGMIGVWGYSVEDSLLSFGGRVFVMGDTLREIATFDDDYDLNLLNGDGLGLKFGGNLYLFDDCDTSTVGGFYNLYLDQYSGDGLYREMNVEGGRISVYDNLALLFLDGSRITILDISRFNNEQEDIALSPGWNMVTPPFVLADSSLSAWFESVPGYYTFNTDSGGYDTQEYLRQSIGVLTYSDVETTLTMTGDMIEAVTLSLKEGWNMCGGPSFNIDTDQFAADSSIVMPVYILDAETRNYQETDRIQPGQGFWILSTEDHEFVIE